MVDLRRQLAEAEQRLERARALETTGSELEACFQAAIDLVCDTFALFDENLNFIAISQTTLDRLHVTREQIVGKNIIDVLPYVKSKGRFEHYFKVLRTGEPWSDVDLVEHPRLGKIHRTVRAFRVGNKLGILFTDITRSVKAEEEIGKFKQIIDHANYGIGIAQLDGKLSYINAYWARIHGYNPERLIGKNLKICHPKTEYKKLKALLEQIDREGGFNAVEVIHEHKNGKTFPMLMNGMLIHDADGQPWFYASTAIDVSEKAQAQLILKTSEARYRCLIDNAPLGIALINAAGILVSINPKMVQIFGVPAPENLVGTSVRSLIEGTQSRLGEHVRRAFSHGESVVSEIPFESPWGRQGYIRYHINPVEINCAETCGVQIIIEDVTQWIKLREAQDKSEKLGNAEEFANIIGHALKTLHFSLDGGLQFLSESKDKTEPALHEEALTILRHFSIRLYLLAMNLIDLTLTRQLVLQMEDIPDLIRGVRDQLSDTAHQLNVSIELSIQPRVERRQTDPERLRRILLNICLNALDASKKEDVVLISARCLPVKNFPALQSSISKTALVIEVRDQGAGMTPEQLPRIFDPFYTTKGMPSAGLGLSSAKKLAEELGGIIEVDSEPVNGSLFRLVLPG